MKNEKMKGKIGSGKQEGEEKKKEGKKIRTRGKKKLEGTKQYTTVLIKII